jgi:DNA polymerase III delta prime subunit
MYKKIEKSNSDEKLIQEYIPRDPGIVSRFLMTKPHQIRSLGKSYPGYKSALFFKAVNEVVKDYDVRAVFDLHYGQVISPSYSYLEVGRGKREELLVTGMRFLIKDKKALAAYVTPGWGTVELYMSYNEKDSDIALGFMEKVDKYMAENNFYKGEKIDAAGQFLPIPELDFDSIKLPEDKKQAIKIGALEFFKKKEIYDKNKIPFKRGLIFTGLPGTGKTHMGKILMNKSECTFIWVNSNMCSDSSDVKYIFRMAKELAPSIIFMEDLDGFLSWDSNIASLKTQMDGMEDVNGICTILCTNFPDRLPKALINRPSRFDEIIIFELPDENIRYQILRSIAEPMLIKDKDNILLEVAKATEGLTGAHLKEIIVYSLLLAADDGRDEINHLDLSKAVEKVKENTKLNDQLKEISVKSIMDELKKK